MTQPIINSVFGVPNRVVLIIFAILKSVLDCFVIYKLGEVTFQTIDGYYVDNYIAFLAHLVLSSLFIWDAPFMFALLDGACEKSRDLIKFAYSYSMMSILYALGIAVPCLYYFYTENLNLLGNLFIGKNKSTSEYWLVHIGVIGGYAFVHILMILVMKSEMIILANRTNQILQSVIANLRTDD